ncbi:MAG: hypothetical protein ABIJ52_08520 [Pseudomonadota bacterium]
MDKLTIYALGFIAETSYNVLVMFDRCRTDEPELLPAPGTEGEDHLAACHLVNGEK